MIEPVREVLAVGAPLIRSNVDTDAIIPSREMKSVSKRGLAEGLFAGWRYTTVGGRDPNPSFVLNQSRFAGARILLGGENFGCGSSREHAGWALHEYGIRAVIAPSFAPIFFGNCVRNGIVPIRLSAKDIAIIAEWIDVDPQARLLKVNVAQLSVEADESARWSFELDLESRDMLLEGLDAIDLTLKNKSEIDTFLARDAVSRPWIYQLPEQP
ncbi:MAG: 3-isopropylmalate dehydratase small subunit [Steroidobacteraceae bacterium]